MNIIRNIEVPTGNILVVEGQRGPIEMLSIGDYGQEHNLKCDAIGLSRDLDSVNHKEMLPLEEKWVITISTQYGCSMRCSFCDVPKVGSGRNATFYDMVGQILTGIHLHPEVERSDRLNIHFARMGEPSWNPDVLDVGKWLKDHIDDQFCVHPVVTTMMPKRNKWLKTFVHTWMRLKNRVYRGNAGLQISINSTDEAERAEMFNSNAHSLVDISEIMRGVVPYGRKITLNFPIAEWTIDPEVLLRYFNPELYIIKLTPMHKTVEAVNRGIQTSGDYTKFHPYAEHEERLKKAGYDVLVFIASKEEDEGLITCGNAILSGTTPTVPYKELPQS